MIRFHDLRHTFATTLAAAGVPLRTIAEYLSHADLTTQIYAHCATSAEEVERLNAAFGRTSKPAVRERRAKSASNVIVSVPWAVTPDATRELVGSALTCSPRRRPRPTWRGCAPCGPTSAPAAASRSRSNTC